MLFLKVPKKEAEKIRLKLVDNGIFVGGYQIIEEDGCILLPVNGPFMDFEIVEREAGKRKPKKPKSLKEALAGKLGEEELDSLINSFDIVGDIAIVEIPQSLEKNEREIGNALMEVHPGIKTVLKKLSGMEGRYRVRQMECIAGENRTVAMYKECGVRMRVDLSKVYFSVRLATERKRIAMLARDKERILVLFAGVGPYALVISKLKPGVLITAVEINPVAVECMKENISMNRMDNITPILCDAKKIALEENYFDRVIMPLPKSAADFLDIAFRYVKDNGWVHFYTLADMRNPLKDALDKAVAAAKESLVSVSADSMRVVRPYSPSKVQVVLDLRVHKGGVGSRQGG